MVLGAVSNKASEDKLKKSIFDQTFKIIFVMSMISKEVSSFFSSNLAFFLTLIQ
jgi:hypothetical protein